MCRCLALLLFLLSLASFQAQSWAAAPDADLPREVTINGVEFVFIPSGWFMYSVSSGEPSQFSPTGPFTGTRIWLDGYYVAKYEARARDLVRFMNAGAASADDLAAHEREMDKIRAPDGSLAPTYLPECTHVREASGRYSVRDSRRDLPAANLSWNIARQFAEWMGFRLPTEAEWEKAGRGPAPDTRNWPWGDEYPDDTFANLGWTMDCHPAEVTAYPKGRSPYGLFNMAGNVAEYVADWRNENFDVGLKDGDRNPPLASTGTPEPYVPGPLKMTKGGAWPYHVRESPLGAREASLPHMASARAGVRFAIDVAAVRQHLAQGTAIVGRACQTNCKDSNSTRPR